MSFPGKVACPYGSEAVWAATVADIPGSDYGKAISLLKATTRDQKSDFSLVLWYATPDGMHVCRLCKAIIEGGLVHYQCPVLVAAGVDPPEPSASVLQVVDTLKEARRLVKSLKEAEQDADNDVGSKGVGVGRGGDGPGGASADRAHGEPEATGTASALDVEVEASARHVAQGSDQGRAILAMLKDVIGDLTIVAGGATGSSASEEEERAKAAGEVWSTVAPAVLAFLRASTGGRDILSRARLPDGTWRPAMTDGQLRMILGRLDRLRQQVEDDWAQVEKKRGASAGGAAGSGESVDGGGPRVVPTSIDMADQQVGTVMALSKVEYIRLPGSGTGVALGKRDAPVSGVGSKVLLALRLGLPGSKVDYHGVSLYLATAVGEMISAESAEEAWKARVIAAVQRGEVPVFTGSLAGTGDGRSERWSSAFKSYRRFLEAHHSAHDPLIDDVKDVKEGVMEAVREHGVVLVDTAWTAAVGAYNRLCARVVAKVTAVCTSLDPGFGVAMREAVWPSLATEFSRALQQEVMLARMRPATGSGSSKPRVKEGDKSVGAGKVSSEGAGEPSVSGGAAAARPGGAKPAGAGRGRIAGVEDGKRGACWFGVNCTRTDCAFSHPEGAQGQRKRFRGASGW